MQKRISIIVILIFLFFNLAFADTSIKAEVDKTKVSTDEILTYKLIVTSSEKNTPQPKLPEFKDFLVISEAESSTVSFLKEGAKTILVYAFILAPKSTGKFTIGPAQIKADGKTYSSEKFEIEVTPGPSAPKEVIPESEEQKITL